MNTVMSQSNMFPTRDIVRLLRETLCSRAYATRLETIHAHYHNSKNEARYRDALLEEFNVSPAAGSHCLRAYAEANKVDMVVTRPGMRREGWLRVELKYQFAYDFASRVRATLAGLKKDPSKRTVRQQLDALPKNDLKRIVVDCIGTGSGSEAEGCDVFVLIVQDRRGAAHPDATPPSNALTRRQPWLCPELEDPRGVRLQFLHEQVSLDARHTAASYDEAWMEPAWETLKFIHGLRGFNLDIVVRKMTSDTSPFPLTSYLFTLDFTEPGSLPENAREFVARCRSARGG